MITYKRTVNYYETDQMAIVHHSNYIRWLEEARIFWLEKSGFPYAEIEAAGIMIPVLDVYCKYLSMVKFGQTVEITMKIAEYTPVRFAVIYTITIDGEEKNCTIGSSCHCFMNKNGRPVSIKKLLPKLHEIFTNAHEEYKKSISEDDKL